LPKAVKLKKYLAGDLPLIRCDENQMITVFSNIIENAFEAMGSTGTLTIRTSLSEKIADKKIFKLAEIKIEDTGTGISQDVLKNLFKPFHSTKAGGTGLGLVIAKRILEAHKGNIRIESKLEIGTIVTIKLPIFDVSEKA
jgi:signal transduction histidine kinase